MIYLFLVVTILVLLVVINNVYQHLLTVESEFESFVDKTESEFRAIQEIETQRSLHELANITATKK